MPRSPKHPSVRARNSQPNITKEIVRYAPIETPEMPERYVVVKGERVKADWHPVAVQMWNEIWGSELADEFLTVDLVVFRRLLALETMFWEKFELGGRGTATISAEIQQIIKEFGLTRMRRHVLGWTIAQTEESQARTANMRQPRAIDAVQGETITLPPAAVVDDDADLLYD